MASGEPVVQVLEVSEPATLFPQYDMRQGGSTPAERVPVWRFDAATIEYLDFKCVLQGYQGGGLTFTLPWSATSATSGVTRWGVAIRRVQDDAVDIDTSHSYDYNEVDDTAPSAAGELSYPTISFADGADMDNWANGDVAIVRVRRNASHTNDTMTGDAELWGLWAVET